ncbi:hypothetical protein [Streptomyces sp. NPDC015680]|uniref:hypothetical protein n=1 Tax=unclassified Streptomyces TaxID=2593676 RepID=UPI0036F6A4EE
MKGIRWTGDIGIPLAELDERAERVYVRLVAGIAGQAPETDRNTGEADGNDASP